MTLRSRALCAASGAVLALLATHASAQTATAGPAQQQPGAATVSELVVTAQKREESIQDVPLSITAATGETLTALGVTDTSQLDKIVPGFTYTPSFYGTPIYTIRGVGFLDTSLAGSPTVTVYVDEVPLPFSIMSTVASLDPERVEVLKGPQGTLFGSNATGGAVNYIAAKPTDDFAAGFDVTWSRFNQVDAQGFVSGPLADTLSGRVSLRTVQGGRWQESYTRPGKEWGEQDLIQGRAQLQWEPNDRFSANLSLAGFVDNSDTQMPHLFGIAVLSPNSPLDPRIGVPPFNQFGRVGGSSYPFAPADNRAADWSDCANVSPFNPPFPDTPIGATRPERSTDCAAQRRDNDLLVGSLRMDWDLTDDITLTSLSSYQDFNRDTIIEGDGTIYQDYESRQFGEIEVLYQELRLAGTFGGQGTWVVGLNYEEDKTLDRFLQTYGGSTANPTALPGSVFCVLGFDCTGLDLTGVPLFYLNYLGPTAPTNEQTTETKAVFASAEFPITEQLTVLGGIRYTELHKDYSGCGYDGGDGSWAQVSQNIQNLLAVLTGGITIGEYLQPGNPGGPGVNVGPGACGTTGPGPTFNPDPDGFERTLDEDNVSWRVGLNYTPMEDILLYGNVSRGYKGGVFPTVATSAFTQLVPATQEELTAYEVGFKSTLLDGRLQLNAAAFYYDYKDKQLLGAIIDPVFGPLPQLVNVPNSHIQGFEVNAVWEPVDGLRIAPSVSFADSEVDECEDPPAGVTTGPGCHSDGRYFNFDPFSQNVDLTGQDFPSAPELQASLDVQYDWMIQDGVNAFVGANVSYRDDTPGFFFSDAPYSTTPNPDGSFSGNAQPPDVLEIKGYTLLDLRAGVEFDRFRVQAFVRNVTDEYYWHSASHVNDVLYRYTGQPRTYGVTVSYRFD
jgi:iron complex outermembrane recepter protein